MQPVASVHSFKLDQRGLARVFGELEAQIMEVVWDLGEPTVQDVCDRLGEEFNYKTVMTVMNRLVEKDVLKRRRESRAFCYSAAESREEFLGHISRNVVDGLLQDFGDLAIAQFVNAMDTVDSEQLAALERMIRARKAAAPAEDGGAE